MRTAFAGFQDPHAWLIRGLVQNNWPDITRQPGKVPPGYFGGFDLSQFSSSNGREGVILHVPAVADGKWLEEDGVYTISCKVTRMSEGGFGVALRCPDANYLEEFPFDIDNPQETLELIQRALTAYVPDFVRWRMGGGEVPWSQRAGTPEVRGEPCSAALHLFVRQRVTTYQSFDNGPAENWWLENSGASTTAPNAFVGGPIAIAGNAGKDV